MQVACSLGLNGDAARLLSTQFPGGLGDAGALPDNLWLNNIPASKEARSHLGDAVCDAVVQAILEEAPTLQVTVKPPELDPVSGYAPSSRRGAPGRLVSTQARPRDGHL